MVLGKCERRRIRSRSKVAKGVFGGAVSVILAGVGHAGGDVDGDCAIPVEEYDPGRVCIETQIEITTGIEIAGFLAKLWVVLPPLVTDFGKLISGDSEKEVVMICDGGQFMEEKILGAFNNKCEILDPRKAPATDCAPLWGITSICGGRSEMEDAGAVVPQLMEIPSEMLSEVNEGSIVAHFFGVYDGHGGRQVADYCSERIHKALIEEVEAAKSSFCNRNANTGPGQGHLERAFLGCFQKVDAEVGGVSRGEDGRRTHVDAVKPDTVGSTAVIALICSTHIMIANCGDSRAVLYRGKESIPLSVDHKPNRPDERERIEAAGGKVIHWEGHRVCGVLAMSRSIGDRYLKPSIIPDPEVLLLPRAREDECLILASDGLWDVMTNEEACEVARKRILLWHKKNSETLDGYKRGEGADPAAQAAADHLTRLAIQKGSRDNITVIIVDLKAQRKLKKKAATPDAPIVDTTKS